MITSRLDRAVRELVEVSARAGHLPPLSKKGVDDLKERILDQFAKGDYEAGIAQLIGKAHNTVHKRATKSLAESALLALGVDVHQAKETVSAALVKLSKGGETIASGEVPDLRASPIRGAFSGLTIELNPTTERTLKQHAHQNARLEASLKEALAAPDRTEALRTLEAKLELAKTPDAILIGMLTAHREDEKWADVIRLYDASPPAFRELPWARREHALALAQTGKTKEARDELNQLIASGDRSNVTLGLFGRILKDRYDRAITEGDPKAPQYLEMAAKTYRMGFRAQPSELYPGVALPVLLEAIGTPESKAESKAIASVVLFNAERRGRFGENNYFDSATALEMACVLGDSALIQKHLGATLAADSEVWMRGGTAKNLERLLDVRGGASPEIAAVIDALRSAPARKARPRQQSAASFDGPTKQERVMAALSEQTYRTGGHSSKWLSGNYAYSGIAHDVRVTPNDVVYFARLMRAAKIDVIEKPLEAVKAMDALIRGHFGTEHLEDLKSEAHQRYDRVMPGLARFMAASNENSQTNVSADWINGLADCRQHAPVKLMLWEAWKRARTDKLLEKLTNATTKGDTSTIDATKKATLELARWEMRILDAGVFDTGSDKLREEHTMTLLVKRGAQTDGGPLALAEEVHLADSFYQNVYPFGSGLLDVELDGKRLRLVPKDAPHITLEPAQYSTDRSAKSLDYGQLLFRGQVVAMPGWEKHVPVAGLDLSPLHDYVDAKAKAEIQAANDAAKPKPLF